MFAFEVEHIQPRSAGGDDSSENLALASCDSCNPFKSDATAGRDEVEARQVPFFHPRQDRREEHLALAGLYPFSCSIAERVREALQERLLEFLHVRLGRAGRKKRTAP